MSHLTAIKNDSGGLATATPATVATVDPPSVASVATVSVATSQKQKGHSTIGQRTSLADMVKSYSGEPATATVATPATHEQVPEIVSHSEANKLTERWHWFLSLAAEHGIHPDVAGAEFPTDQDRLDVVEPAEHDDDRLRKCMATLCRGFTVRRRQQLFEADRWVPVALNHYQNLSKG